jgi:GNAT superfamily N-acetyltransferase
MTNDASEVDADIHVARATLPDVPAILSFIRELAEYERLSDRCVATEAGLREHLFGPRPAAEVLIARVGGPPAGFALYFGTFSTFLAQPGIYLEDLYVRAELRRRGVGRALLQHLARIAVSRGCGRLEWAALDWNDPAIRFYEKIGAVKLDEWTTFRLGDQALARFAVPDDRPDASDLNPK